MRSRSKAAAAPHARSTLRGTHAHASFREGMRAGPALARSTYEGSIAPNGTAVEAARAEPEANAASDRILQVPFLSVNTRSKHGCMMEMMSAHGAWIFFFFHAVIVGYMACFANFRRCRPRQT